MSVMAVYMTARDKGEALKIAKVLLEKKLIACANIFDNVTSVYEWDGNVCEEGEAVAIFKTQKGMFEPIKREVLALHSYEVPALFAFEADETLESFAAWTLSCVTPRPL